MDVKECKSRLIMMGWLIHHKEMYEDKVFKKNNDYISFQGERFVIIYYGKIFGSNNINVKIEDIIKTVLK